MEDCLFVKSTPYLRNIVMYGSGILASTAAPSRARTCTGVRIPALQASYQDACVLYLYHLIDGCASEHRGQCHQLLGLLISTYCLYLMSRKCDVQFSHYNEASTIPESQLHHFLARQ